MLTPDVQTLFLATMNLPVSEQASYLRDHCPDPDMRREVESLLEHDLVSEAFLDSAVQQAARALKEGGELSVGETLGPYRIESVIGRGGMGVVYRGERMDGQFAQTVAIKILGSVRWRASALRRFQEERAILAGLSNSAIAQLLDGGTTDGGVPYYVMEFVDGCPIDDWAAGKSNLQIVRLFLTVCEAVSYAHRNLIVHRDIKPDNILVRPDGVVKLLDFGIARVLSEDTAENTTRAMTPSYASPEQMTGAPVRTASDIYSLGCVLYRLLAGQGPYRLEHLAPAEVVEMVCRKTPDPPAGVERDLQAIVLQAIEKEPDRRYVSVDELRNDLLRWMSGKPVKARGDDRLYRARKWIARHWLPVAAAVAVTVSISTGVVVSLEQARHAEAARQTAERERGRAETAAREALAARAVAMEKEAEAERQRGEAIRNLEAARSVAGSLTRMFDTLFTSGDARQALAIAESWLAYLRPIADANRENSDLRKLAGVLELRHCGLVAGERPFQAPKVCESAIARFEPLLGTPLDDEWLRVSLSSAYGTLGKLKTAFGQAGDGEKLLRKAVAILEPRVALNPRDEALRGNLDATKLYLAGSLLAQKRWQEAATVHRDARNGMRAVARSGSRRALVVAAAVDGTSFSKRLAPYDAAEASRIMAESLELLKQTAESPGAGVLEWNEYANALNECTDPALRRPPEALRFAMKAAEASKNLDARALDTLAWAYYHAGDQGKAADTIRRALNLTPAAPRTPLRAILERGLREFEK